MDQYNRLLDVFNNNNNSGNNSSDSNQRHQQQQQQQQNQPKKSPNSPVSILKQSNSSKTNSASSNEERNNRKLETGLAETKQELDKQFSMRNGIYLKREPTILDRQIVTNSKNNGYFQSAATDSNSREMDRRSPPVNRMTTHRIGDEAPKRPINGILRTTSSNASLTMKSGGEDSYHSDKSVQCNALISSDRKIRSDYIDSKRSASSTDFAYQMKSNAARFVDRAISPITDNSRSTGSSLSPCSSPPSSTKLPLPLNSIIKKEPRKVSKQTSTTPDLIVKREVSDHECCLSVEDKKEKEWLEMALKRLLDAKTKQHTHSNVKSIPYPIEINDEPDNLRRYEKKYSSRSLIKSDFDDSDPDPNQHRHHHHHHYRHHSSQSQLNNHHHHHHHHVKNRSNCNLKYEKLAPVEKQIELDRANDDSIRSSSHCGHRHHNNHHHHHHHHVKSATKDLHHNYRQLNHDDHLKSSIDRKEPIIKSTRHLNEHGSLADFSKYELTDNLDRKKRSNQTALPAYDSKIRSSSLIKELDQEVELLKQKILENHLSKKAATAATKKPYQHHRSTLHNTRHHQHEYSNDG